MRDGSTAGAARAQLDWLIRASARLPLPGGEIGRHLAPTLLRDGGGPAGVNAALGDVGPLTPERLVGSRPGRAQAIVRGHGATYRLTVRVDGAGAVDGMALSLERPPVGSWADLDGRLGALGPRVSFAAAEIGPDGGCRVVHGVDADVTRPVGSAFKLYVLGALARAVADGRAGWDERLAIRQDHKSLPSGRLQDRPAGETLALAELADHMISISDNTATDHLIHRLGRGAVQDQLALFGHHRPAVNVPFLSTRAFFRLRTQQYPDLAERYLASDSDAERAAAVARMEALPVPEVSQAWPRPRMIDRIGWFASAVDLCRAMAGLHRFHRPEIDHALSLEDEGLNLDLSRFATVWFKGGSEPGVLTLTYLARTADGRASAVSLLVSDPHDALAAAEVTAGGLSVVRDAFDLLERAVRPA